MAEAKWKTNEIKNLFKCVEKSKINGESLMTAFKKFAKSNNRKPNSVRNYYYEEIANLKNNEKRQKELNVDLSKHQISTTIKFTLEETKSIVKEILRQKCLGKSTRCACLELANNDIQKMIRYQNKFRSVLKNNKQLYDQCLEELKREGLVSKAEKSNVIYLKKQKKSLSDEDVNSLFMGLIKLVKKSAVEEVSSEAEFANSTLRKTLLKLSETETKLKNCQIQINDKNKEIEGVKDENHFLKAKIAELMSEKIVRSSKNKKLISYLKELRERGGEVKTKI